LDYSANLHYVSGPRLSPLHECGNFLFRPAKIPDRVAISSMHFSSKIGNGCP
jgi:hypothetical protein